MNTVHQKTDERTAVSLAGQGAGAGNRNSFACLKLQQQIDYSSEEIPVQKKGDDASGSAAGTKAGLNPSRI